LFLLLLGGSLGLPIPEDIPLLLGGVIAHRGNGSTLWIFVTCYISILLGDMVIYCVGMRFGPALFEKKWFKARITPARIAELRKSLETKSILMIFVARHLYYFRTVTFLTCGAVRMSIKRFLSADAAAALISVPLMLFLGYKGSENAEDLYQTMGKAKNLSILIGVLLLGLVIFYFIRRRRRAAQESGQDGLLDRNS
jgi:LPXTG-motif cell wall-anchored protein